MSAAGCALAAQGLLWTGLILAAGWLWRWARERDAAAEVPLAPPAPIDPAEMEPPDGDEVDLFGIEAWP